MIFKWCFRVHFRLRSLSRTADFSIEKCHCIRNSLGQICIDFTWIYWRLVAPSDCRRHVLCCAAGTARQPRALHVDSAFCMYLGQAAERRNVYGRTVVIRSPRPLCAQCVIDSRRRNSLYTASGKRFTTSATCLLSGIMSLSYKTECFQSTSQVYFKQLGP